MFTALLIAILVVTGAAAVVGGGLVFAATRRSQLTGGGERKQLTDGTPLERDSRDIRPGDIITREDTDFLVEGVIRFNEDGHRWSSARLTDGESESWLIIGMERLGPVVKRIVTIERDHGIAEFPPDPITMGGIRYSLEKRGTASAQFVGDCGEYRSASGLSSDSVLRCRWWRYEGPGRDTLIVEQWGEEYRVLRGTRITDADYSFMPGS